MCGLVSKLKCPDFVSLINEYEIVGIQESKTDDLDIVDIPGYKVFLNNRSCSSRYRSGGIALVVKDSIGHIVKVDHQMSSKLVLFFSLLNVINDNGQSEDLKCGIVYVPPQGSKYASDDTFQELREEFFRYCIDNKNMLIFGDFNARTGELSDYVKVDACLSNLNGFEDVYNENTQMFEFLNMYNIPLERKSLDKIANTYGHALLDMCKNNDLFILNGRIGEDGVKTKLTCKDKSTVDYSLSSGQLFRYYSEFQVNDFANLFSDAHCGLSLCININLDNVQAQPNTVNYPKAKLWNSEKSELFTENLDITKVMKIEMKLDQILEKSSVIYDDINDITSDIANLFETTSIKTFGFKKNNNKPIDKYSNFKPWFNKDCINARHIYHKTRKMYNKYKSEYYKNLLKAVSKNYKHTLNKHKKQFQNLKIEKLRRIKNANPKEYWKIINSTKKPNSIKATLHDLYSFYKETNTNISNESERTDINEDTEYLNNETINTNEINQPITGDEIKMAAKSMKNNKAGGVDNIVNEHLKSTVNTMLPIYVKLFNLIFDTSLITETWTLGQIKPIYKNKGDPKQPENYRPITLLSSFGKLFTSIINKRLTTFAENHNTIGSSQAGFRKNYSTADNLFTLKSLIDIVQSSKKMLF